MNKSSKYISATWEKITVLVVAVFITGITSFLVIRNEPFADSNFVVLIRILLSLATAVLGAAIPGFLNITLHKKSLLIRASGALALFLLTFTLTPKVLSNVDTVQKGFPISQNDKQMTRKLLNYLGSILSSVDRQYSLMNNFYNEAESYIEKDVKTETDYNELNSLSEHIKEEISKAIKLVQPIDKDVIVWANNTKFSTVDIDAALFFLTSNGDQFSSDLKNVLRHLRNNYETEIATKKKVINNYRERMHQTSIMFWYGLNELLIPINRDHPDFANYFEEPYLRRLAYYGKDSLVWRNNIKDCQLKQKQAEEQVNILLTELASFVGDQRVELSKLNSIPTILFEWLKKIDLAGKHIEDVQTTYMPLLKGIWSEKEEIQPVNRKNNAKIVSADIIKNTSDAIDQLISKEDLITFGDLLSKMTQKQIPLFKSIQEDLDKLEHAYNQLKTNFDNFTLASNIKEATGRIEDINIEFESIHLSLQWCGLHIQYMLSFFPESNSLYAKMFNNNNYIQKVNGLENEENLIKRYKELNLRRQNRVAQMKNEVEETNLKTQESLKRIKVKYAIKPSDSPEEVWGKAIRLLSAGYKQDCISALETFKNRSTTNNTKTYTDLAIKYIQENYPNDFSGGVIVIGFNERNHSTLKVGDIITAIDGIATRDVDEFVKLKKERNNKGMEMTVWRFQNDNKFHKESVTNKSDEPLVGVATLGEVFY